MRVSVERSCATSRGLHNDLAITDTHAVYITARLRTAATQQRDAVRAALLRRSAGRSAEGDEELLQARCGAGACAAWVPKKGAPSLF